MNLKEQLEKIRKDVHCHYQELTALNIKKHSSSDHSIENEIIKIHKLIIAKNALIQTLSIDFGLD
jgi:hypothetical protein